MKVAYSLAFFVLILLLVAGVFFWLEQSSDHTQTLRRIVQCRSEVLDDSVLGLDADTTLIGAFITFDKIPLSTSTKEKLKSLDVTLDEGSQIFEISSNILAKIPTASLCELSKVPGISSIFIPELNTGEENENSNVAP